MSFIFHKDIIITVKEEKGEWIWLEKYQLQEKPSVLGLFAKRVSVQSVYVPGGIIPRG